MCRENGRLPDGREVTYGTSLRVQGEPWGVSCTWNHVRNIPACAGRTSAPGTLTTAQVEHPCVCRENIVIVFVCAPLSGTSLRVQGEPRVDDERLSGERNIPSCAGRTLLARPGSSAMSEHPCVCRENRGRRCLLHPSKGTSLRVQGELDLVDGLRMARMEHPCVCRENFLYTSTSQGSLGTSLRVQGERLDRLCCPLVVRNIPACAGRTMVLSHKRSRATEHPCVCRENPV